MKYGIIKKRRRHLHNVVALQREFVFVLSREWEKTPDHFVPKLGQHDIRGGSFVLVVVGEEFAGQKKKALDWVLAVWGHV